VLSVVRSKNIEEPVVYVMTLVLKILHHNNVHGSAESSWVIKHYVLQAIVRLPGNVIVNVQVNIVVIVEVLVVHVAQTQTVLNVVDLATVVMMVLSAVVIQEEIVVMMEHHRHVMAAMIIGDQIEIAMHLNSLYPASCSVGNKAVVVAQTHAAYKFTDLVASLVVNARTVGFPVTQFFLGISPTMRHQKEY
jgi:hypothetical protein